MLISRVSGPRKGIVAAAPHVLLGVKNGDRVSIRPNEPAYLFLPNGAQSVRGVRSLATSSRFIIAESGAPPYHTPPRAQGRWVTISVAPGTRSGTKEQFVLEVQPTIGRALGWTEATFTVVALGKVLH